MRLWWCLWWSKAKCTFGGSQELGGRFCVGALGRNLASVAEKMFPSFIWFIKKFYKCSTFNTICTDNAENYCITFQHRKCSFLSTSTGITALVTT
jgi:hypothetical protein